MRVIAIDGPAGSGKSTVARALAARLGPRVPRHRRDVPGGHLRRAAPRDRPRRARSRWPAWCADLELTVGPDGVVVDGVDATIEIRGPEVSRAVSIVAANPDVRARDGAPPAGVGGRARRRRARGPRHRHGGVPRRRAQGVPDRRSRGAGRSAARKEVTDLDYETVAADLARRDALDQGREVSPLTEAPDAFVVDTTGLDVDEIIEVIAAKVGDGG